MFDFASGWRGVEGGESFRYMFMTGSGGRSVRNTLAGVEWSGVECVAVHSVITALVLPG